MKKYSTQILSLLLSLTLSFSVYSIYDGFSSGLGILLGALTVITTLALFGLCYFTERHRFLGGCAIIGILYFCLQLYRFFSMRGYYAYGQSFIEWLLTKGGEAEGTYYLWTLYIFFTTFFSFTVYYFSNVLYRMFFLTVVSLIPAVIYLKVLAEMDNVFLVMIVLLNIAVFISHRKKYFGRGCNPYFGNTLIAGTTFILLLSLITSLIPKNAETPYYDVFEDAFLGGDTSSPIGENFSELSSFSGDAGGFFSLSASNRKLYTITCSVPTGFAAYMKRQNFDYYDFDKDHWYADPLYQDAQITPEEHEEAWRHINLSSLQSALLSAQVYEPGFLEKYGLTGLSSLNLPEGQIITLSITSENFGAVYYLAPTQCLNVQADRDEAYYATAHGAFYSAKTPHPTDFTYTTAFYHDDNWRTLWLQQGGRSLSNETAGVMLQEMNQILTLHKDSLSEISQAYLSLQEAADAYKERCQENNALISPKLTQLALSLTEGLSGDYEKALALANYFHENEFVYDLEYRPRDDSPEYFLFTSKRGSCSDYASAYTLLARAAGLTVRYAEGYVTESGATPYARVIKSRDSHAYPEVFIPNLGWMVFEPTVARMDDRENQFSITNFFRNLQMDYGLIAVIIGFAVLGIVGIMLVRFLLPLIGELLFGLRLLLSPCDKAVVLSYNRLVKKAVRTGLREAPSKTPYELACMLQSLGCDMTALAFAAESVLYGGATLPSEKKRELLSVYRAVSMTLFQYRHGNRRRTNFPSILSLSGRRDPL
ncbi:MAG: transglutaminase-like domain-containing protein [Roseburia sp.]|nr:transglutaminase-like domain-containing protein [Roseburia sp.]